MPECFSLEGKCASNNIKEFISALDRVEWRTSRPSHITLGKSAPLCQLISRFVHPRLFWTLWRRE